LGFGSIPWDLVVLVVLGFFHHTLIKKGVKPNPTKLIREEEIAEEPIKFREK
jgi:hypothetical protein